MKNFLLPKQRETLHKRLHLMRTNAVLDPVLREIPREQWPHSLVSGAERVAVWRSAQFLVQFFEERGCLRMSVNRAELNRAGDRWKDGITWDELMEIKRGCGFGDKEAVELYPRDADVVNVANIRHLWFLPEPVAFAWRKEALT